MVRMLALLLTAMTLSMVASAQGKLPKFNAYPATVEKARAKKIDFRRSPGAGTFKTRLTAALREGTDFAGHYKIAGWGCGTGCISGAVIDVRSGRVYFPEEFYALSVGSFSGDYESEPLKYKSNSRMLILSGIPGRKNDNGPEQQWGDYYYEWKNNRFHRLKFVKRDNPQ